MLGSIVLFVTLLLSIGLFNYRSYTERGKGKQSKMVYLAEEGKRGAYYMKHYWNWHDYDGVGYHASVAIAKEGYKAAKKERINLYIGRSNDAWEKLYGSMADADAPRLGQLYAMFDSIRVANTLDSIDFATMVVSFVQEIPYVLVHDYSCSTIDDLDTSRTLERYHADGSKCLPRVKYGIQSPVEFMYTQKGDCDSRTVFLYTVLRHYNYDVAILNSEVFMHSVLGIHLNVDDTDAYLEHEGKRYYMWETTEPGYKPGELLPGFGYTEYWKVVLTS